MSLLPPKINDPKEPEHKVITFNSTFRVNHKPFRHRVAVGGGDFQISNTNMLDKTQESDAQESLASILRTIISSFLGVNINN